MNNSTSSENTPRKRFPTFRKLASPRALKAVGTLVAVLVTLVALFYAVENWRGAREWNRVRAELVEKGEPLTVEELLPPMPPDELNFAMSSLFDGAFDDSIDPETGESRSKAWADDGRESVYYGPRTVGLELRGDWRLGERPDIYWKGWRLNYFEQAHGIVLNTNSPSEMFRQCIELAGPELSKVETTLRERPASQFPVRFDDNIDLRVPHLAEIKRYTDLFQERAILHLREDQPAEAFEDVISIFQLADTLRNEALLISQINRQNVVNDAVQVVWEGLRSGKWSKEQAAQIQLQLASLDLLESFRFGMRGDRLLGMEYTDILERDRNVDTTEWMDWDLSREFIWKKLLNNAPRGWYLLNKAFIAEMHALNSDAVDPQAHRVHLDKMTEFSMRVSDSRINDHKLFVANWVLPAFGQAVERVASAQAGADLAIVACALERYRLENGEYPESLEALSPKYIAEVPHDVIDGEPLRYRREGGRFVLYSIGSNEVDDGGVPGVSERGGKRTWVRYEGDWVWTYPDEA